FRRGYVAAFGAVTDDDPLYEAVSAGRKYQGMEHWLPLFYEKVETVFDYLPGAPVTLDPLAEEAREERLAHIADYYQARADAAGTPATAFGAPRYKPLPPDALYLMAEEWARELEMRAVRAFSPFKAPEGPHTVDAGGARGRNFAPERKREGVNVFDALATHIEALHKDRKRVMIACWSKGSRERMGTVLADHGVEAAEPVPGWREAQKLGRGSVALSILGLEHGFETADFAVIGEQDILGDRLIRRRRGRRAENFLTEASSLPQGDLVVHVDHGIGRYEGLRTIDVAGAPHDCLELIYHGGDKLLLPVENIELLSRYGTDDGNVHLDRLGGHNWQARKARLKERIRDMAERLIKVAAERALQPADAYHPEQGLYEEFCARFPYEETEDQERSIADVIEDLGKSTPMDRLVCGDVGFGKTEVALRAAFVAAMSGKQVAIVVPTTLLARQHYSTFTERFAGWPLTVRQLSRMVGTKKAGETRKGLADGSVDIVIGTHALLSKNIRFRNLGLLIVDEEQHFGVAHKERIKQLKANVHVLTLTATPIPRTLQLAMSGIKELSIIATPPVDRLAIRTFVSPFDPVVVREALLREHYRGGQSFFVCPRIADLREVADFLDEQVPEVKYVVAHGQMPPSQLEEIMAAFYDGRYDVLVSTTIVESGLDIPTANTLIVHRADRMGLAQLYQIRGRIGRSKQRGYAYLTVPPRRTLTANAEKRLKVLQSLDSLGAGFTLASHDLDIRGAGNLLGEEQSGHVREVGVELYQAMLEEAVAGLRSGDHEVEAGEQWSPHINVGTAVLIPEDYVEDLNVRLSLYRRLADLEKQEDIDAFAAELIDRFGPLPEEVTHLLAIIAIKGLCRAARVSKVDAGPKGITLTFRPEGFPNVPGLVDLVSNARTPMKLKPDGKLVYLRGWAEPMERLDGTHRLLSDLAELAAQPEPQAA
ncbi:MAG: transcription-repair coupling factor, partial [Alphaproteobacteria bacterium]